MNRRAVNAYLRVCADRMGLKDWKVEMSRRLLHAGPDCYAEVLTTEDRNAEVAFCKNIGTFTKSFQRGVVAHELAHLYTSRVRSTGDRLVTLERNGRTRAVLRAILDEAEENVVEGIAQLVVRRLPLPRCF